MTKDLRPGKGKTKTLKKWAKQHGFKWKRLKLVKMNAADMMGYIVPPPKDWTPPPWYKPDEITHPGNPWVTPRSLNPLQERINKVMERVKVETKADEQARQDYDGGKGLTTADIIQYCNIHSQRAREEGLEKTGLVIDWAAGEIERLANVNYELLRAMTREDPRVIHKDYVIKATTACASWINVKAHEADK